ncbi:serine protease [uncultured Aquimarina sp.]|uniref:S1 family peptidase n=1 Tax=uncultured Aquimarina sp. TaxID=575652 RepID=UPI00262C4E01|nr:serine protease [uncultured Aquimarina sp.]
MKAISAYFNGSISGVSKDSNAIVPLVSEDKKTNKLFFIGTSFYISGNGILLTAKHCIFNKKDEVYDNLGVIHFLPNNQYILRPIRKTTYANEYDVAYLLPEEILDKEKNIVPSPSLILTDRFPELNEQLGTFGYPDTQTIPQPESIKMDFISDFYLGKYVEFHKNGIGLLKNSCFQTTIKMKSGSSGGPVFNKNGTVIGICSTGYDVTDGGDDISFATPLLPTFSLSLEDDNGNKKTINELIEEKIISFKKTVNTVYKIIAPLPLVCNLW